MASKLRVDEIVGAQGSTVSIGTATFTGGLSGDITGLNVTGVITATTLNQTLGAGSSITIGNTVITSTSIGIGTTTTSGRNAGVGTAVGTLIFNSSTNKLIIPFVSFIPSFTYKEFINPKHSNENQSMA